MDSAAPARHPEFELRSAERRASVVNTPVTPASALDDERLIRRIARREREAFSQLYDRYAGVLYSTAMRVLNDAKEANDVLQAVFVQIWDNSPVYEPALGKPFNWALAMTRKKAIDRLHALQRRYAFFAEITGDKEDESEILTARNKVSTKDQAGRVRDALATLPYEQRQAIELAYLGGMTADEIAETLGQPPGALKARIRRGMLKLRESLRQHP